MTTDTVANNIDEQVVEHQPVISAPHGQSADSERAEPADESDDVTGQDASPEQRSDAERGVESANSAVSEPTQNLPETVEIIHDDEDFLAALELMEAQQKLEEAQQRKNTTSYKVTQIRSHSKIEKREATIELPDGVTPDDINVELYFEGDDGFEDAGHRPHEIKIDWEILERSHTDCTLGVKLDIRKSVVNDFAVTKDELIVLGREYLKTAYDLDLPYGYPWSRRDRWDYVYSWERYAQIEEYIAKSDGIPCIQFEVDIYAYEKLLQKANSMSSEEWADWAASELRKALLDYQLEAMCPPINEQLRKDAIARWEERKERAKAIADGDYEIPHDAAQNEEGVK